MKSQLFAPISKNRIENRKKTEIYLKITAQIPEQLYWNEENFYYININVWNLNHIKNIKQLPRKKKQRKKFALKMALKIGRKSIIVKGKFNCNTCKF